MTVNTWAAICSAALISAGCTPALKDLKPSLDAAQAGTIWFASAGTLVRSADGSRLVVGDPVPLSGVLDLPAGAGPFPAVILAHGCAGPGSGDATWLPVLREWGYATFLVDSFRGRGLTQVCTNSAALTPTQRIPDVYGALRILSTHPKIDARRVALMGFSHGGDLTLRAATAWAKETYVSSGQASYRAFFPFYGSCNYVYPERRQVSAPLRIHHGELDDWLPVAPCIKLVESLRASNQDAEISVYPGARHSFDNLSVGSGSLYLPFANNPSDCTIEVAGILGPFPYPDELAARLKRCLRKGATVGYSAEATEQAKRVVRAQLAELLKP